MYPVHDWAEVHRLYHCEGSPRRSFARRLGMSRTTVIRLLGLPGAAPVPPAGAGIDAVELALDPGSVARAATTHAWSLILTPRPSTDLQTLKACTTDVACPMILGLPPRSVSFSHSGASAHEEFEEGMLTTPCS